MLCSLQKFLVDSINHARYTREEYGKAIFNHLRIVRPDLAEAFPHPAGWQWIDLIEYIQANWHKK